MRRLIVLAQDDDSDSGAGGQVHRGEDLQDRLVDADLGQALEHRGAQLGVVGHRLAAGLLLDLALSATLGGLAGLPLAGLGPSSSAGGVSPSPVRLALGGGG